MRSHFADMSEQAQSPAEPDVRFGPGIWSGALAVIVGIIPDPAPLAIVPAVISLVGATRTLTSRRIERKMPGWVGLALGLLGLLLAVIAILDFGHEATIWSFEPPIDTCDVSPFCSSF